MLYCAAKFTGSDSDFQLSGLVSGVPAHFTRFFRLLRSPRASCFCGSKRTKTSPATISNDDIAGAADPASLTSSAARSPLAHANGVQTGDTPPSSPVVIPRQESATEQLTPAALPTGGSHSVFAKAQRMFGPASSTAALASVWYLAVLLLLLIACKATFPTIKVRALSV